jgi:hypothetical protein
LPKSTDLGRAIEADEQRVEHIAGVHELVVTRDVVSSAADAPGVDVQDSVRNGVTGKDSLPVDPAHPDYIAAENEK